MASPLPIRQSATEFEFHNITDTTFTKLTTEKNNLTVPVYTPHQWWDVNTPPLPTELAVCCDVTRG